MKFTYLNYGDNILRGIKADEKTIVVFSDYALKNMYLRNREKNILRPEGKYFTFSEFCREIFKTDKMILTEAKRPLTLYTVLDEELKEKLNIRSYYDIIDFADLFFKYYRELSFAMVEDVKGLQEWQKEYISRFEILKKKYDEFLKKNDFIPSDWIEDIKNFNRDYFKDYKKIIFADVPYFPPLIKKILKETDGCIEIEILMQISQEDYDEENLKIKKISLSKEDAEIKIYENSSDLSELVNLVYILKKEKSDFINENIEDEVLKNRYFADAVKKMFRILGKAKEIYSPASDRNKLSRILPKYFTSSKMAVLDETKLYKFMKIQNELLISLEPRKRKGVPAERLKEALNEEIFRKIYNIDNEIFNKFSLIFSKDYKYIDKKIFEEDEIQYIFSDADIYDVKGTFYKIYEDLEKIEKFRAVDEFLNYIKELGFENFREENYIDIVEKFYQGAGNIKSSEKLCGKGGFKKLFGNSVGSSLYTLLIKYMEGIEIKEVEKERENLLGAVKDIENARLKSGGKSYFIDIDSSFLPSDFKDGLIFSESQRAENGLMTFEEKKNIEKYRFIQGIYNCGEAVVFTKKTESGDVDKSQFLEELILKYKIKTEENPLSKDEVLEAVKNNLYKKDEVFSKNGGDKNFHLEKSLSDFENHEIRLGTYDVMNLEECRYRYFLEKNACLSKEDEEKYGVSMRFLGNTVHKIFDEVSKKVYENIRKGNFYLEEKMIDGLLEKSLQENKMKIPVYMDLFLKEVLLPKIKENIFKFYREIEKDISGKKVELFFGEKSGADKAPFYEDEIKIFIKGRADLMIETADGGKYIIDYKTGGEKTKQLDIYSIIMYGDENSALKRIYNAVKGEYKKIDKSVMTKENLKELFKNFLSEKEYLRAEKNSSCNNCIYKNICRRGVEL